MTQGTVWIVGILVCPGVAAVLTSSVPAQCESPEIQKLEGVGIEFGRMVLLSGDLALVGAPALGNGSVYAYRWDGTHWMEFQNLAASDGEEGDRFGYSGAIDGTTALISAPFEDTGALNTGSVYVFEYDGSLWHETDRLNITPVIGLEQFGFSVALANGVAVIGAPFLGAHNGQAYGAAHVFRHDGSRFVHEAELDFPPDGSHSRHGQSVATDGHRVLVTSIDGLADTFAGAAYSFEFDGSSWVRLQKITAATTSDNDYFGWSVAMAGSDRALISAIREDDSFFLTDAGAVYSFFHDGSQWVEQQRIVASNSVAFSRFGTSVDLDRDRLVVGAPGYLANAGAAYGFHWDGSSWVETHAWIPSDALPLDGLGISVALDGRKTLAGALDASGASPGSGAAYAFDPSDLGLDAIPDSVAAGEVLELRTCGGQSGSAVILAAVAVQGIPAFLKLDLGLFDPSGVRSLAGFAAPGLSGLAVDFLSIGYWQSSTLGVSNTVTVPFQ